MNRHLLSSADLTRDDVRMLLATASEMHEVQHRDVKKLPTLRGRTVINLFFEDSTRTRSSFEIAGKWMSADTINITGKGSSASKGESLRDTVRTIDAMSVDALVIRHMASGAAHQVSQWVDASVINAGDGTHEHPTQALLDAYTIEQRLGDLDGARVAIVGDLTHSRVFRSNAITLRTLGAHVTLVAPPTLMPSGIGAVGGRRRPRAHRRPRRRARLRAGCRDDAARPARADERRLLPDRPRVHRGLRPDPRPPPGARRREPGGRHLPPRPDEPRPRDQRRRRRRRPSLVLDQVSAGVAVRMSVLYHLLAGEGAAA